PPAHPAPSIGLRTGGDRTPRRPAATRDGCCRCGRQSGVLYPTGELEGRAQGMGACVRAIPGAVQAPATQRPDQPGNQCCPEQVRGSGGEGGKGLFSLPRLEQWDTLTSKNP